jgi:hypothetical protein
LVDSVPRYRLREHVLNWKFLFSPPNVDVFGSLFSPGALTDEAHVGYISASDRIDIFGVYFKEDEGVALAVSVAEK